jgi:SdrD B-like protein
MNRMLRMIIPWLAALSLILSGCNQPVPAIPTMTPMVLTQPSAVPSTPTAEVQEVVVTATPLPVPADATLYGLVWEDLDGNGLQDLEELGVPNVTVNLLDSARTIVATATTDSNGTYQFTNLSPGDYFVNLTPPTGFVFSPQDQGMNELVDSDTDPTTAETIPVTLVAGDNGLVFTTGIYSPTASLQAEAGTVQPPPNEINVCVPGNYSLGGVSTLTVNQLATGYCLHAFLWNHSFALGRIPGGAGRILSAVTFVEYFYQGTFVYQYDVPGETDSIQVCYAVPTGMQAQIYFFDHYGPRFGHPHQGQPSWMPLQTTIQNGIACAVAQTSGAYALIGK